MKERPVVSCWCFSCCLLLLLWSVHGFQEQKTRILTQKRCCFSSLPASNNVQNFPFTGIRKEVVWQSSSRAVPAQAETALYNSGVLFARGEFGLLSTDRKREIEQVCQTLDNNMELVQALSLRQQTMVTRTVHSNGQLKRKSRRLSQLLASGTSISELCVTYNQPPVAIMRAILDHRIRMAYEPVIPDLFCKMIVKAIVMEELDGPHLLDFLNVDEQIQLQVARDTDTVTYVRPYDTTQRDAAAEWENSVYAFLDKHHIRYWTEEALRDAGASRTPDVLLLDDCVINGRNVRWMDCKNFYGSASAKHYLKNVRKQIQNYEQVFSGPGAIVYKHGYSSELQEGLSGTLLLNRGPLEVPKDAIVDLF